MKPVLYYLLQLFLASGLLYGYYHFVLRNKKFHHYNRFYLLAAVVISIIIPFLDIPFYFTPEETRSSFVLQTLTQITFSAPSEIHMTPLVNETTKQNWFTWQNMLYAFYLLLAFIFFLRVLISLQKIRSLIKKNKVERLEDIRFVNTQEPGTPFSFFKWLFWNTKIDLHSAKGEQVFRHELFHIQQRHSWDILFMELISVVFWLNPFFHLLKKELKAIHEFLADEFAIKESEKWQYAELLLMQAFNTRIHLTNPFFHNQIKRRIAMITSFQKPRHQYLRKLLVLPITIIVIGLFAFSYKEKNSVQAGKIFNALDTSKPEQKNILLKTSTAPLKPFSKKMPEAALLKTWQDAKKYGVWIDNKRIANEQLINYDPSDFSHYFVSKLAKNAVNYGNHYYQVDLMTNKYYENYIKNFDYDKQYTLTRIVPHDTIPKLKKYKNNLIVIDGEIKDEAALEAVLVDSINSIWILQGKKAIEKYGDKGKNGVIEIITKGNPNKLNPKEVRPEKVKPTEIRPEKISPKEVKPESNLQKDDNKVFVKVEIEPSFTGGEEAWKRYLNKSCNFSIPAEKGAPKGAYTVFIQFIVDKEGNICDIRPLTKHGYGMEEEVIRIISKGPRWEPAIQNGHKVNAYKKQRVDFVIKENFKNEISNIKDYNNPANWDRNDPEFMKWRQTAIKEVLALARKEGKAAYYYKGRTYVFAHIDNSRPENVNTFFESDGFTKQFVLNGKIIRSIDEINSIYLRKDIKTIHLVFPGEAKDKFGVDGSILEIETYDHDVVTKAD